MEEGDVRALQATGGEEEEEDASALAATVYEWYDSLFWWIHNWVEVERKWISPTQSVVDWQK
jgi:hypothetical protein